MRGALTDRRAVRWFRRALGAVRAGWAQAPASVLCSTSTRSSNNTSDSTGNRSRWRLTQSAAHTTDQRGSRSDTPKTTAATHAPARTSSADAHDAGCTNGQTSVRTNGRSNRQTDIWAHERRETDGQTNASTDVWTACTQTDEKDCATHRGAFVGLIRALRTLRQQPVLAERAGRAHFLARPHPRVATCGNVREAEKVLCDEGAMPSRRPAKGARVPVYAPVV
jgi:hypothetical protein